MVHGKARQTFYIPCQVLYPRPQAARHGHTLISGKRAKDRRTTALCLAPPATTARPPSPSRMLFLLPFSPLGA
eukprot:1138229-Pelagomonas_calceolata.AAC.1